MAEDRSGYGGARPKTTPPIGYKKPKSHYKETDEFHEQRKPYRYQKKNDRLRFEKYGSYDSLKHVLQEDAGRSTTRDFRENIKDRKEVRLNSSNITGDLRRNSQQTGFSGPRYKPKTTIETLNFLDSQDGDSIVQFLNENKQILKGWLLEGQHRPDLLPLILSVLSKAFSCNYLAHKTADLIQLTIEADLLNIIALHILDLQSHGEIR